MRSRVHRHSWNRRLLGSLHSRAPRVRVASVHRGRVALPSPAEVWIHAGRGRSGAFWLWTAGTLTTFVRNGFERVAMLLRTGHVDRPDILLAAPAACVTGALVIVSLWGYSRARNKTWSDLGLFVVHNGCGCRLLRGDLLCLRSPVPRNVQAHLRAASCQGRPANSRFSASCRSLPAHLRRRAGRGARDAGGRVARYWCPRLAGNVRQLVNEVRGVVAFAEADSIVSSAMLSPEIQASPRTVRALAGVEPEVRVRLDQPLGGAVREAQW